MYLSHGFMKLQYIAIVGRAMHSFSNHLLRHSGNMSLHHFALCPKFLLNCTALPSDNISEAILSKANIIIFQFTSQTLASFAKQKR